MLITVNCFHISTICYIFAISKLKRLLTIKIHTVMKVELLPKAIYIRTKKFSIWWGWLSFSKNDCFIPSFYFNWFK